MAKTIKATKSKRAVRTMTSGAKTWQLVFVGKVGQQLKRMGGVFVRWLKDVRQEWRKEAKPHGKYLRGLSETESGLQLAYVVTEAGVYLGSADEMGMIYRTAGVEAKPAELAAIRYAQEHLSDFSDEDLDLATALAQLGEFTLREAPEFVEKAMLQAFADGLGYVGADLGDLIEASPNRSQILWAALFGPELFDGRRA